MFELWPLFTQPATRQGHHSEHVRIVRCNVQSTRSLSPLHNCNDRALRFVVYQLRATWFTFGDRLHRLSDHLPLGVVCAHALSVIVGTNSASGLPVARCCSYASIQRSPLRNTFCSTIPECHRAVRQ